MRTRLKARLEAELAAVAAAKDQQPPLQDNVVHQPPSLEHSPEPVHSEPGEKIGDKGEFPASEYMIEPSQSSESEPEEEISDVNDDESDDDEQKEKSTEQQESVNDGGTHLLLLDSESTRNTRSFRTVTGGFASSLKPDIDEELYFDFDNVMMRGSGSRGTIGQHGDPDKELMKRSVLPPDLEKRETAPLIYQSQFSLQKLKQVRCS